MADTRWRYRVWILALAAMIGPYPGVSAGADAGIRFDDQTFQLRHTQRSRLMRVAEYRRAGEGIERWTRRIAVRQFPNLKLSPRRAVISFSRELKLHFHGAQTEILQTNGGQDAQIDFMLMAPDRSFMQFGVRHYVRRPGYAGLISYEFAYRLTDLSGVGVARLSQMRHRWIAEMLHADWPVPFPADAARPGERRKK